METDRSGSATGNGGPSARDEEWLRVVRAHKFAEGEEVRIWSASANEWQRGFIKGVSTNSGSGDTNLVVGYGPQDNERQKTVNLRVRVQLIGHL